MTDVKYYIDNVDFESYNVFVSSSKGLMDLPKAKAGLSVDWKDHNGDFVDLQHKTYEKREITLDCFVSATGYVDFMQKANAFIKKWRESGLHVLHLKLSDAKNGSIFYFVHLDGGISFTKTWNEGSMVGTFSIKLIEPEPMKIIISNHLNDTITISGNASRLWKYWKFSTGVWQYDQMGTINISFASSTQDWIVVVANSEDISNLQVKKGVQDVTSECVVWKEV